MMLGRVRSLAVSQGFLASLLVATCALLFVSPEGALALMIVLGQAHFFITYWYQFKAHKLTASYITLWVLAALALFLVVGQVASATSIMLITGTIFFWHFYLDELRLSSAAPTAVRALLGLCFALSFGAVLAAGVLPISLLTAAVFCSALCVLCGALLVLVDEVRGVDIRFLFFSSCATLLLFVEVFGVLHIPVEYPLCLIVLSHYVRWYVHFGVRFYPGSNFNHYIGEAVLIQIAILILYGLYVFEWTSFGLPLLFTQTNFFLFTLLHIFFSYRASDYVWLTPPAKTT